MDDPWGSPWAEEDPPPRRPVAKQDQKRPVTPEKPLSVDRDSKSPWDDNDDEFGEWSALPATDGIDVTVLEDMESAVATQEIAPVNKRYNQGADDNSDNGRSAWGPGTSLAIKLGDGQLQVTRLSVRQLSPDPWARDSVEAGEARIQSSKALQSVIGMGYVQDGTVKESIDKMSGDWNFRDELKEQHDRNDDTGLLPAKTDEPSSTKPRSLRDQGAPKTSNKDQKSPDIPTEGPFRGDSLASRPSSSPSDHSHHETAIVESPRTSFEDEDKHQNVEEKSSFATEQTVLRTDSLFVDVIGQRIGDSRREDLSQKDDALTPASSRNEEGFESFEDEVAENPGTEALKEEISLKSSGDSLEDPKLEDGNPLKTSIGIPPIDPPISPSKFLNTVRFQTDLLLLRQIFEDKNFGLVADPYKTTDVEIIEDSFTSTEQRKTWYRVSRYGTTRKHNAGDEDTYIRTNWKGSKIRAETIEIVARWIEEDLSGGIILGGGRPGSLFGWGQKNATPLTVAAALASKRGSPAAGLESTTYPQFAQIPGSLLKAGKTSKRNSLESMSKSKNFIQSPSSATAPQFTWSTGTPMSATFEAGSNGPPSPKSPSNQFQRLTVWPSPQGHSRENLRELPTAAQINPMLPNPTAVQPVTARSGVWETFGDESPKPIVSTIASNQSVVEDDDWGEMISTPSVTTPPVFLPFKQRHKSSQSLVEPLSATHEDSNQKKPSVIRKSDTSMTPNFDALVDVTNDAPCTTSQSNPWPSADFSIFDTPAAPPSHKLPPLAPLEVANMQTSKSAVSQHNGKFTEDIEQIRIVKSVVQNLPDLSYMLRR